VIRSGTIVSLALILALLTLFGIYIFFASVAIEGASHSSPESSTSTPDSQNGLEVVLSISGSKLTYGETINITVGEYNTLTTANNVSVARGWADPNLASGPCVGAIYPPIGIAVFKGNYDTQDINSAQPLQIIQPGTVLCPALYYDTTYYTFHPSSNLVTEPVQNVHMNFSYPIHGYWSETTAQMMKSGGNPSLVTFPLGSYTVAAGDKWGDLTILHFTVALL